MNPIIIFYIRIQVKINERLIRLTFKNEQLSNHTNLQRKRKHQKHY